VALKPLTSSARHHHNGEIPLADKRKRRMEIRIKRHKRAKRKLEQGFKRVIERSSGRRKVRFVKPAQ